MSGQRRALLMMMPLSTEKASVGRPAMFQLRIFTGSPSVAFSEKSSEHGMPFAFTCTQTSRSVSLLNPGESSRPSGQQLRTPDGRKC